MVTTDHIGKRVHYPVMVMKGLTQLTEKRMAVGKLIAVGAYSATVEEEIDSPICFKLTRTVNLAHVSP